MALKSDAYGFLVGAPVEWGRALQIFNEIRDEVRALRGDIAGGSSIRALERAADAVSRQATAVSRATATTKVPPRASSSNASSSRAPKPAAVVPTRSAASRAAPIRGANGRFVSATPAPSVRQPYRIPVVGVDEVATPTRAQPAASEVLTAAEFEARRAKTARPSSRDEIRRQNSAMSQTRAAPLDTGDKKSAASPRSNGLTQEQIDGDRAADRQARNDEIIEKATARGQQRAARAAANAERRREREFVAQERHNERVEAQIAKEKKKEAEKPGLATHTFNAVGSVPDIDPTIAAAHEVQAAIAPIGRGLSHLFGRSSRPDAWYKRIWNELRGQRKDQSTFHKAEQKTLQQIDDKTGAAVGGGLLGLAGGFLRKIPGVGLLGSLLGGGAQAAGGIGRLALRAGGGLLKGGGGLLRRLPFIGMALEAGSGIAGAFGANDDPSKSAEENRAERFRSGGAGIGAALGGAIGLLGGPLGSVVGQVVGDKVGELVGKWLSTLDWAKIGASISGTWDSAVKDFSAIWDNVSKWLKDKFGIVTNAANKANDYIKDKTGVDVKATTTKVAQAVASAASKTAEVAKTAVTAAATRVTESATSMAAPVSDAISSLVESSGVRRVFRKSDGSIEQREGGTVSWRNNNPGNLKFEYAGSADKTVKTKRTKAAALAAARARYNGVVDLDQWGNAIFNTAASGDAARAQLIKNSHGSETVDQMLSGYAKDDYTGKANIGAYSATINKVASARGLNLSGKKISDLSDAEFAALMDGMKQMEGYRSGTTTAIAAGPLPAGGSVAASAPSLPAPSVSPGVNVPAVADTAPPVPASLGKPPAVEVRVSKDAGDVGPTVSDPKIARLVSGGLSN
jgi:hypothetical protein